jgi:hypothetical protein
VRVRTTKRRQAAPELWSRRKEAAARRNGRAYKSTTGATEEKRRMGPRCIRPNCRDGVTKCLQVPEAKRKAVFRWWWKETITWEERHLFIQAVTDVRTRRAGAQRIRNQWRMKLRNGVAVTVRREFVASTLGMDGRTLSRWLKRQAHLGPLKSKAAKSGPKRPITEAEWADVDLWLALLPKVESHYCWQEDNNDEMRSYSSSRTGLPPRSTKTT